MDKFIMVVVTLCFATILCLLGGAVIANCGGCMSGDGGPLEGIVTAKEWVPQASDMMPVSIPDGNGGLMTMMVPVDRPEQWRIWVGSRSARVSREEFERVQITQHWRERR